MFKNWPNILTFGEPSYESDREGILLQTLTLYIFNLFDMTEAQVKKLNKQLPEPEMKWINTIPEIFGEPWKQEGLRQGIEKGIEKGIEQGREENIREITIKMLKQFPDWSDTKIAELVGSTEDTVRQIRQNLLDEK